MIEPLVSMGSRHLRGSVKCCVLILKGWKALIHLVHLFSLSAHKLSTPFGGASGSGGSGMGGGGAVAGGREAENVLKDSSPAQRVKVAKELMEAGKAAPSLVRAKLLLAAVRQPRVLPRAFPRDSTSPVQWCNGVAQHCWLLHAPTATSAFVVAHLFLHAFVCVCALMDTSGA